MLEPIIRIARPGDEVGMHESHMRSIREVCSKDHSSDEIKGWGNRPLNNRWVDAINSGYVWVVEFNNQIHGHAYIKIIEENNQKRAHIHGLYLTPEVIGKKLGSKLGKLMINKAFTEGAFKITLESTLTAHDFYKRLGFTDSGPMSSLEIAGYPVRYFPMSMNFDNIIHLEKKLLDFIVRKNPVELDLLLADDFIEFGTSGKIYDKKKLIEILPKEGPLDIESFDFRINVLSVEVVQLTFKTRQQNVDGSFSSSLRCSIWKKNGKQWQLLFHQGTKTQI